MLSENVDNHCFEPLHQLVVHELYFWRGGRWHFGFKMPVGHLRKTTTIRPIPNRASSSSRRSGLLAASTSMVSRPPKVASVPSYWVAVPWQAASNFDGSSFGRRKGCEFLLRFLGTTMSPFHMHKPKGIEVCQNMGKTTTPSTAYSWPTAASWGVVPGESKMADWKIHQSLDLRPKKIQAIQPGKFN